MQVLFARKTYLYLIAGVGLLALLAFFMGPAKQKRAPEVTATVETGEVATVVSVSGFVEAPQTAELSFPNTGVVTTVLAEEGDQVQAGDILATQVADNLLAQRAAAVARLTQAEASYQEALAGATDGERTVAAVSVANAESNLALVEKIEAEKVENAWRTVLSTGLEAIAVDSEDSATAPTVTGTYTCETTGTYTLSVYNSSAASGYSYTFSGLESGSGAATVNQPSPLGDCGLYLQFTAGDSYTNTEWEIILPNTRSSSYIANQNAYDLAVEAAANAIATAANTLALAQEEAGVVEDGTRDEVVLSREAAVIEAQAKVQEIDALLRDRSVIAPFAGEVTNISIVAGETASVEPVITLLATDAFELTARIPEIDITKIATGQSTSMVFDAQANETVPGTIGYISPLATEIDGVAYFETTIVLTNTPDWLRAGLNADIDITTGVESGVLRLPQRFLFEKRDGSYEVLVLEDSDVSSTTIEVQYLGNDGYAAIEGLPAGTTVTR